MTAVQKIIKYFAIAFAIFLIVTIISTILSGGYVLLRTFGLIQTDKNIVTDNLQVISSEVKEISTLKINMLHTNLKVKEGDSFKVETNNSKITFSNNNGSVIIKEEKYNWSINNNTAELIIYMPKDMITLDETKIETGAGSINIEKLSTQVLELELGAGDVNMENIIVTKFAKIDGGAGRAKLKSSEINNLKANLGIGEFIFSGKLIGKNEIDSGVGKINIDLLDNLENYTIDVDKGIGTVTLNEKKLEMDRVYGTGKNHLEIDGGIGEIKINFK